MSKKINKAKKKLEQRIKSYEETCSHRVDDGKGFHRPGSLKAKR